MKPSDTIHRTGGDAGIEDFETSPVDARAPRLIGAYDKGVPGPTTIFVAGVHGNEPMGIEAVRTVFDQLHKTRPHFAGRVFGLIGHARAAAEGKRLLDHDLNRAFQFSFADGLKLESILTPEQAEHRELVELLHELRTIIDGRDPDFETIIVDMHTFSGEGAPFCTFSDTVRNRKFAACWPVPVILGLVAHLRGTLADYCSWAGCISVVLETGQNEDPRSAALHASSMRLALAHAGHMELGAIGDADQDFADLHDATADQPRVLDVQVRHPVKPEDAFRMRPGHNNFKAVEEHDEVADDRNGPIKAERGGRILLPLYQEQGEDGYFIARPIGRFWLALSTVARLLHLDRLAPILAGVDKDPTLPRTIVVNRHIARFLVDDVFHLLGYRLLDDDGETVRFTRRPFDFRRPRNINL